MSTDRLRFRTKERLFTRHQARDEFWYALRKHRREAFAELAGEPLTAYKKPVKKSSRRSRAPDVEAEYEAVVRAWCLKWNLPVWLLEVHVPWQLHVWSENPSALAELRPAAPPVEIRTWQDGTWKALQLRRFVPDILASEARPPSEVLASVRRKGVADHGVPQRENPGKKGRACAVAAEQAASPCLELAPGLPISIRLEMTATWDVSLLETRSAAQKRILAELKSAFNEQVRIIVEPKLKDYLDGIDQTYRTPGSGSTCKLHESSFGMSVMASVPDANGRTSSLGSLAKAHKVAKGTVAARIRTLSTFIGASAGSPAKKSSK